MLKLIWIGLTAEFWLSSEVEAYHLTLRQVDKPKVPLLDRTCKLCSNNCIEDEMHFLMSCDFYSDLRRPLFEKAQTCNTDFHSLSLNDKFIFVMNFVNTQHILSSTLLQMFARRKRMQ